MKTITILFKTHLDIGFTGLAEDVCKAYPGYIRTAIATAEAFRKKNPSPEGFRYRWTVGSWLIDLYFAHATPEETAMLERAIRAGDIVWHAMPFTTESEVVGPSVFRAGLTRSAALNTRFGKHVHSAKLTDVPGHTRGIIGPFVEAGVTLLHIGTNPGCGVCTLPEVFRWRDSKGREIYVVYQTEYGQLVELPDGNGFLVSVANDNAGAHSVESVETLLRELHEKYPEAELRCGTLDDLSDALDGVRDALPVITSEIGSTWVHSAGTDPWKIAQYRACVRWAEATLPETERTPFLRELELVTEHTGGLDTKTFLHDNVHWAGSSMLKLGAFHPKDAEAAHRRDQRDHGFAMSVRSWDEQREYIDHARDSVLERGLAHSLNTYLRTLQPLPFDPKGADVVPLPPKKTHLTLGGFVFDVDLAHGCLKNLSRADGTPLFSEAFRLSSERFGPADYDVYHERYLRLQLPWCLADFGKPGMPERPYTLVEGVAESAWMRRVYGGTTLVLRSAESPKELAEDGPMYRLWETEIHVSEGSNQMEVIVRCLGKNPSRSAHAVWCTFTPAPNQGSMSFTKLGEPIDPTDVVEGGGRSLHAIDGDIRFSGGAHLETLDAPLLSPGVRDLLWAHNNPLPKVGEPFHINLYNNIWGCNFPMWFGDDMMYRFIVR